MATLDDLGSRGSDESTTTVDRPLLFDGQRLDQPTFHELYLQTPEDFRAELIDGVVALMNMPVFEDHGRSDLEFGAVLYLYSIETPGTIAQANTTTILGPRSEVQPDSALRIDPAFGGRTRKDARGYHDRLPGTGRSRSHPARSDSTSPPRSRSMRRRGPSNMSSSTMSFIRDFTGSPAGDDRFAVLEVAPDGSIARLPSPGSGSTRPPSSGDGQTSRGRHTPTGDWRAPSMPISSRDCGGTAQTGLDDGSEAIRMVVSPMEQGRRANPTPGTRS